MPAASPYRGENVKAIRRITVRPVLPEPLAPLHELARNLRWSWHTGTRDLFQAVDPGRWAASDGDPVRLLGAVPHARLAELAADAGFLRLLGEAADDLRSYAEGDRWYQKQSGGLPAAVGYFSPSSASPPPCRSTPAASASSPETTSRRPVTSGCR